MMQHQYAPFARLVAFLAGLPPLEIWPNYRVFEDDCSLIGELLELLGDEAKPILEERARARE